MGVQVATLLLGCVCGFGASSLRAADDAAGDVPAAEVATAQIEPPALLDEAAPEYPADAEAQGVSGTVSLQIDLDEEGRVFRAEVLESPDARLGYAALGAAVATTFTPAKLHGNPIRVRVGYSITFALQVREEEQALSADEARALQASPDDAPENFVGQVFVAAEQARVPGALIYVEGTDLETYADEDGNFSLRGVPEGERVVHVEATGYEPYAVTERFAPNVATAVRYFLRPRPDARNTTVIRERKAQREVTRRVLTRKELTRIPGTFGDAIRVVQRLPGVSRAPFGLGAVVVRGGAPDDSSILIDGHEARILFHLGAGPSVINTDLVDTLDFYPGGFGARFGRATAGVINVQTRDPNFETWSGKVTADLLQTGFRLEGPLLGGSVFFAGRRSYVAEVLNVGDVVARFIDLDGTTFTLAPRYYDYQAKAAWKLGAGHRLSVSFLGTDDVLDFAIDAAELGPGVPERVGTNTGFHRLYTTWRYTSPAVHDDGRPVFQSFFSPLIERSYTGNSFDDSLFRLDVGRISLQGRAEYRPFSFWGVVVGIDDAIGDFQSSTDLPFLFPDERLFPRPTTSDPPRYQLASRVLGTALGTYVETDVQLGPLLLVGGLRADWFSFYDQVRTSLDPRLAVRFAVLPQMTLKGSVGQYHKIPSPFELAEEVGNPDLPLEEAVQYSVGFEHWLTRSTYLEWEVFYRALDQLPEFVVSPTAFATTGEPRVQAVGQGRVLGSELLLRQHLDRGFFGWVAYTLLRSERRSLDDVKPRWRVSALDQTHIFSFAMSYQLPWNLEVGGAVRYVTGNPQTFAAGGLLDTDRGRYLRQNGPVLGERLPAFFQLDLRIDQKFVFDNFAASVFLDVQNATNQQNFEFFTYNYDFTEMQPFPGLPILPVFGFEASF